METIIKTSSDNPDFRRIFINTFCDEPSFKFMLPNDIRRKNDVAWLVDMKLKSFNNHYHTYTTKGIVKGFSWWIPPNSFPNVSTLSALKNGYWKAPFKFGISSFKRMVSFSNQETKILQKYISEPYWVLDVIATDPNYQRTGLGGQLMKPVFDLSDRQSIPCFVLTHNVRNVGFYQKYGFKLVIEEPLMGLNTPIAYGLERIPNS